jgi:hypothetical protein
MTSHLSLKNPYLRYSAILISLFYVTIEAAQDNDFVIFLSASADLVQHKNIYTALYKGCYHYYYSPLFAILLYPFTLIPVYTAKLVWLMLNLVFVFRTWKAMAFFLDRSVFNERQKLLFTGVCFLFVLRFLTENFHCGQMTVFLLFLSTEGIYRIMTGRYWFGALLISLAINIKILPLILLPYLFYRRYFKALGWCLLFLLLWLIVPIPILGYQYNSNLVNGWWSLINPTKREHLIDTAERSFHGLSSWLPTLLMDHVDDPHVLSCKRNIARLDAHTVEVILNVIRGVLLFLTLFFLRSLPFRKAGNKLHAFRELSYLFVLIPLVFPHQQHYAFYFLLPACTYLCYYISVQLVTEKQTISKRKLGFICAGMIVVFLTNNLHIIFGEFGAYYEHYKIITYGALMMIVLLAFAAPEDVPLRNENS